jgi:hypothetical protein
MEEECGGQGLRAVEPREEEEEEFLIIKLCPENRYYNSFVCETLFLNYIILKLCKSDCQAYKHNQTLLLYKHG